MRAERRPAVQPIVPIVRKIRCCWCLSTLTRVYKTNGRTQYRRCLACGWTFKALKEAPDPSPAV